MYILCQWDISNPSSTLQIHQLLYIALGDYYQWSNTVDTDLPARPECVSEDMMAKLCSLPIDKSFLNELIQCINDKHQVWERLLDDDGLPSPEELLWVKEQEHTSYSLEDLVVLKAIVPNAMSGFVNDSVVSTVQSLPVSLLTDVLTKYEGGTPLLLLYNEKDLISQANIISFQDTMKSLTAVSVSI